MQSIESKYANLLVNYCLELKPGQRVHIHSSTLAEPLIREVYREALRVGAHPEVTLDFRERNRIYMDEASEAQLKSVSPLTELIISEFDATLYIRAPHNLREEGSVDPAKRKIRSSAMSHINQIFSKRTAEGSLVRSLCQYPTLASAQEAGMSLEEYQDFVYGACHLYSDDPAAAWLGIRSKQQRYVDHLNEVEKVNYKGPKTDITFSVSGRTWINSDGRVNMPSGEVFSGPVEDTVNGVVYFDYPAIYLGREVKGVTLEVERGEVRSGPQK